MATFKKKNFERDYMEEEQVDELVDVDGGLIGNNTKQFNSDSEVSTDTPYNGDEEADQDIPQTTSDFARNTKQKRQYPFYGSNYSSGKRAAIPESRKILAKERMEELIEDLMTQKSDSHDFVNNRGVQDINRNQIPDITDITVDNQALSNSIQSVVKMINSQNVKGDIAGIILNFIVSNLDTQDIPEDFKRIIKSKI